MAEWALLIYVAVIIAIAYTLTRRFDGTREIAITWILAGLLIALGLGVYGRSKVERINKGLLDRYRAVEEEPP